MSECSFNLTSDEEAGDRFKRKSGSRSREPIARKSREYALAPQVEEQPAIVSTKDQVHAGAALETQGDDDEFLKELELENQ